MARECTRCRGTGICRDCLGKGSVECVACNAVGSITTELPTGIMVTSKCTRCGGQGFLICPPDCEVCLGKGVIGEEQQVSLSKETGKEETPRSIKRMAGLTVFVPWATYMILLTMLLATVGSGVLWSSPGFLYEMGVFYPPFLLDRMELWRFITAIFLHGGFLHFLSNAYTLYILCPEIEFLLGRPRFLFLFFISGIAGFVLSALMLPLSPTVGASGSLFGIMTSYLGLQLRNNIFNKSIINQLIFWFGLNVWIGFSTPQINIWAHFGGAIAGFTIGYLFKIDRERFSGV